MATLIIKQITSSEFSLLAQRERLSLYAEPYWLESVVGNSSIRYYVIIDGELPIAFCPVFIPAKNIWLTPPNCAMGGLFFTRDKQLSFKVKRKAVQLLIGKIGKMRFVQVALPQNCADALPFYWHGYQLNVRYNYQALLGGKTENLWEQQVSPRIRQAVRLAERNGCKVIFSPSIDEAIPLVKRFYKQKNIAPIYTTSFTLSAKAAILHNEGYVGQLIHANGAVLSCCFIVVHNQVAYLTMLTHVKHSAETHFASRALLYHALLFSKKRGANVFDFEGTMLEGSETLFRQLGGEQQLFIELRKGKLGVIPRLRLKLFYSHKSKYE